MFWRSQYRKTRGALNQRADRGTMAFALDQVAFPMAGDTTEAAPFTTALGLIGSSVWK
jgi:hypothetical protein